MEEKDAQPRANERVTASFKEKLRNTVNGYEDVSEKSESIRLTNAKAEYAMLPVWMMTTRYNNETYTFGINGQTGKMVGALPVDKGLWRKYLLLGSLVGFILMQLVLALVGGFSGMGEVIALILAFVIGFIYVSILKGAMNTIAAQSGAMSYLKDNTVSMGAHVDRFLYTKTDKREKSKS
ncbi:MAG TPA: hypothetical protein DIS78_01670 [Lachnospiraceae bacterium]|nr:hypothetical protein [Lachnospiraceae bacterium]